jgi:hypothetical protein
LFGQNIVRYLLSLGRYKSRLSLIRTVLAPLWHKFQICDVNWHNRLGRDIKASACPKRFYSLFSFGSQDSRLSLIRTQLEIYDVDYDYLDLLLSVRNAYHALLITVVTCSPPQKVCGRNFQKKSISVKLVKKRKREYRIDSSLSESKAIESGVVNNPITTDKLNVLVSKKKDSNRICLFRCVSKNKCGSSTQLLTFL